MLPKLIQQVLICLGLRRTGQGLGRAVCPLRLSGAELGAREGVWWWVVPDPQGGGPTADFNGWDNV